MKIEKVGDLKRQYHLLVGCIMDSNSCGKFEVLELLPQKNPRKYRIRFLNTGYEKEYTPRQIITGSVMDESLILSLEVGGVLPSNLCGDFEVVEKIARNRYKVRFLLTGTEIVAYLSNLLKWQIKDPYFPMIYNVGYLGESKMHKPSYSVWSGFLGRCYSHDNRGYSTYGEAGVSVCSEWHNYSNFKEWYLENKTGDFELDKDLLCEYKGITPKVYSKDTCCFLPKGLNGLLSNKAYGDTGLPLGVWDSGKKFYSGYGRENRGRFITLQEAVAHQIKTKKVVCQVRLEEYSTQLPQEVLEALKFVWEKEISELEQYL